MLLTNLTQPAQQCSICARYKTPYISYLVLKLKDDDCMLCRTLELNEYFQYYRTRVSEIYHLDAAADQNTTDLLCLKRGPQNQMQDIAQQYADSFQHVNF